MNNDAERELRAAMDHYAKDKDTCSACGGEIKFVEACEDCGAPDADCFDMHTFGSCAVCLGCVEPETLYVTAKSNGGRILNGVPILRPVEGGMDAVIKYAAKLFDENRWCAAVDVHHKTVEGSSVFVCGIVKASEAKRFGDGGWIVSPLDPPRSDMMMMEPAYTPDPRFAITR